MNKLWSKVTENQTPLGFYSKLRVAGMLLEGMKQSFDWEGDEMLNGRKKLIHTVGAVGKFQFNSDENHSYTGVFRGCKNVILRPSVAKAQDTSKTTAKEAKGNFVPGMAMKFLRNNIPSANLQSMFALDGQDSWNFFKNDFSNHIPAISAASFKVIGLKFSTATDYIQTMGLKDLGEFNCQGGKEATPNYPFQLIFKPNETLRTKYDDDFEVDYLDQLKNVPVNFNLYDVYAINAPGDKAKKIGSFQSTSKMVTSKWGDESLFFRHNYIDLDVEDHPSWEKYLPKFSLFGSSSKKSCPFH